MLISILILAVEVAAFAAFMAVMVAGKAHWRAKAVYAVVAFAVLLLLSAVGVFPVAMPRMLILLSRQRVTFSPFGLCSFLILFLLIGVLYALIFCRKRLGRALGCAVVFTLVCIGCELLGVGVFYEWGISGVYSLLLGNGMCIPYSVFTLLLECAVLVLFVLSGMQNLHQHQKLFSVLVFLLVEVAGYDILLVVNNGLLAYGADLTRSKGVIVLSICLILLFIALFSYQVWLSLSQQRIALLMEQQKLSELEAEHYAQIEQETLALREARHDMQIHLDVLTGIAAQEQSQGLQDYLQEYKNQLETAQVFLNTGDAAVDGILTMKILEARQSGIEVDYLVLLPARRPLDDVSMASLLGNLWNNAIEACARVTDAEKRIAFSIKPAQEMLAIHIQNTYDGTLYVQDSDGGTYDRAVSSSEERAHAHDEKTVATMPTLWKHLRSRKGAGHGIGLARIAELVSRADGVLQITHTQELFTVDILLPLQEDEAIHDT